MKTKHLLAAAALLLLPAICPAQSTPAPSPKTGEAAPAVQTKTLWEQIKEGGWVMVPIAACSVFTLYLIGDGILRTARQRVSPAAHEEAAKNAFRQGDYVGAYNFCKANPSPFNNVLLTGIGLLGEGKQVTEEGMIGQISRENGRMQTWISYLSVIGVCTPMIGLLGTVTGMIRAFATLGSSGIGDPSSLSAAIGEVLVATASGLLIAIPAFGAFYFLRNRASDAIHHVQDVIGDLFLKMPYDSLSGVQIGDKEIYAAQPNWLQATQ